jgi:serine protease Do
MANSFVPQTGRALRAAALVAAFGAATLAPAGWSASAQTAGPQSVADIAARLQNAVVNISTTQKLKETREVPVPQVPKGSPFEEFFEDFFDRQDPGGGGQRANSLGSGFVIDPSGFIVTNNHVIEGADEITVIFTDGTKLKVIEVVGRDPKTDLALLRVEPKKPLDSVKFGDSVGMRVGDWVMAIGNPFGLGGTVTVPPSPNGLPIAITQSPTRIFMLSPSFTEGSGCVGSTRSSARSVLASRPTTSTTLSLVPSVKMAVISSAPSIT